MSEPIPTSISIGGKIAAKVVLKLCQAIVDEGLAREWGHMRFMPATADDLLTACQEIDGTATVALR